MPSEESQMYSSIQSKFAEALKSNALVYTPSEQIRKRLSSGFEVIYTLAPALAKKPTHEDNSAKVGQSEKASPWIPVEEPLLVEKRGDYNVVLNKFALTKYHFLAVTSEFAKQTSPLGESDWEVAMDVLRSANKESGKRHVGFFNSGSLSGASIDHKHIQFMTLPEHFSPFADTTPEPENHKTGSIADKRMPFLHFLAKLSPNASNDDVVMKYSELLGRVLTTVYKENSGEVRPSVNYNLVFTEEWILATPRRAEKTDEGISINALGTIGLILAKSQEQLEQLEERGLDVMLDVTWPYEDVVKHAPDHTGYTHY